MHIKPDQMLSIAEANQDFSKATRIADRDGCAVIVENDQPCYMLVRLQETQLELSHEEQVDAAAKRIFEKYRKAFEELAK